METLEGFVKDASIDASMAVSLQDSLNNCNTAVARIQQEMEPFVKVSSKNGMAKQRRLSWSFNEIKVIEIRGHLQHGKANLNLWINVAATSVHALCELETRRWDPDRCRSSKVETTQIEMGQQIDVGTEAVRDGFTNLGSQMP